MKAIVLDYAKRIAFRNPYLNWLSRPRYPYNLDPYQLAFLVQSIESTRHLSGSIVEIGVARGMTTVLLNTHLQVTSDKRNYLCVDTFEGFIEQDIAHEINRRGKKQHRAYKGFSYNDVNVFKKNMTALGFQNIKVLKKDVNDLSEGDLGPISVALIDVDLYKPTLSALRVTFKCLEPSGVILVDDVMDGSVFDGAAQAYKEFCTEAGLSPVVIGRRSGVIRKAPRRTRKHSMTE
jgi:predicted O-methyltransferase YrrM